MTNLRQVFWASSKIIISSRTDIYAPIFKKIQSCWFANRPFCKWPFYKIWLISVLVFFLIRWPWIIFNVGQLCPMSVNNITTFDSFHCLQCLSITFDVCRLLSGWLRLIFNGYTQQYIWLNFDCVQLALSGYASKYDQAFSNWCVGSVWFQLNRLWSISKPSILKSLK